MTLAPNERTAESDIMIGLRDIFQALVADRKHVDLSLRQLTVYFKVYTSAIQTWTVRALAEEMNVSKPAITRALDRLAEFNFIQRKTDPLDRRSILVQKTSGGLRYYADLGKIVFAQAFAIKSKQAQSKIESSTESIATRRGHAATAKIGETEGQVNNV
jgi:DNA-binding MarR family transcriptional regulator